MKGGCEEPVKLLQVTTSCAVEDILSFSVRKRRLC